MVQESEWSALKERAAALWPGTDWRRPDQWDTLWQRPGMESGKRAFLAEMGAAPVVWVLSRRVQEGQVSRGSRHLGGRACFLLDCPRLGMGGERSYFFLESIGAWRAFRSWQYAKNR